MTLAQAHAELGIAYEPPARPLTLSQAHCAAEDGLCAGVRHTDAAGQRRPATTTRWLRSRAWAAVAGAGRVRGIYSSRRRV